MATTVKRNVVKEKSAYNQNAHTKARYGNDIAELVSDEPDNDWEDVARFAQTHGNFDTNGE